MKHRLAGSGVRRTAVAAVLTFGTLALYVAVPSSGATAAARPTAPTTGGVLHPLDCNGDSPIQKMFRYMNCTDIKGDTTEDNANTWGGKFYDNGQYIGHDEPDATFLSNEKGSGNDVKWNLTLGTDPSAAPTTTSPGSDVSHWFELTPAPWLSMAICDPNSYPQLPCTAKSDANAPAPCHAIASKCNPNRYPGGGSAFLEMQFYPPGNPPWVDSESCDDTHWCAALTIDSLECTAGFAQCNPNCEEPINFAFVQTDGVPDPNGAFPDDKTLLMNPGDQLRVHMDDAPAPGGGKAVEVVIDDLTQHTSGTMQASAANGFMNTSIVDCSQAPFNFQPEYSTASQGNIIPWAALATNISTEFETGHFEPCTYLSDQFDPAVNPFDSSDPDGTYTECNGAYENAPNPSSEANEGADAMCYNAGDTHPGYAGPGTSTPPDEVTGCQDNVYQNGDLDFDGTPYWPEWPTGTTAGTFPSSFVESMPSSGGESYNQYFLQTDLALSESTCTTSDPAGCTVPPAGPGGFYPYWSQVGANTGNCVLEFGNVAAGRSVKTFGGDAQYGTNELTKLGYPEFEGPLHPTCGGGDS
jgi:hypothetical protein